jgi:hypothetical protein
MNNPTRRNRNIGTAKQGRGKNNKLTIPQPCGVLKSFYERLVNYRKEKININGHDFIFILEQTRTNSAHACSVADIETKVKHIPRRDYGDLKFIVLRQPKRKEEMLSPVWGRLIYSYEFEDEYAPAIILDAVDLTQKLKWPVKLSLEGQKELQRLQDDGHLFESNGKNHIAPLELNVVRNTQLYRTLLHEFGHYVHYLEFVERPVSENEADWQKRDDAFFKIPKAEKEQYAHNYADQLRTELTKNNIIPFERKQI